MKSKSFQVPNFKIVNKVTMFILCNFLIHRRRLKMYLLTTGRIHYKSLHCENKNVLKHIGKDFNYKIVVHNKRYNTH